MNKTTAARMMRALVGGVAADWQGGYRTGAFGKQALVAQELREIRVGAGVSPITSSTFAEAICSDSWR